MPSARWIRTIGAAIAVAAAGVAQGQPQSPRDVLEQAAAAMGGLARLQGLDNLVMTGFGEYVNQQGGSAPSPDPRAPLKWTVAHDAERIFDLRNERALNLRPARLAVSVRDRAAVGSHEPGADRRRGARSSRAGAARGARCRDASRARAASRTDSQSCSSRSQQGATLWLALDPVTKLPAWVRSIGPSTTLGDITTTTYFTGYLPFGDLRLPVGITAAMDWRDTTSMMFHVDSYRSDVDRLAGLSGGHAAGAACGAPRRGDEDRRQSLGRAHRRQWRRRHRVRGSPRDVRGLQQRGRHVRAVRPRRYARAGQEGDARHRLASSLRSQRRFARGRRRAA